MKFPIILAASIVTLGNDSVAAGDLTALVSCELDHKSLAALDAERSDVAVCVRILDSDGVERVAAIDLEHATGSELRCWYGAITIPLALGVGTYQIQFAQRKDINVPKKLQKSGKLSDEIEADDMGTFTVPVKYLA